MTITQICLTSFGCLFTQSLILLMREILQGSSAIGDDIIRLERTHSHYAQIRTARYKMCTESGFI